MIEETRFPMADLLLLPLAVSAYEANDLVLRAATWPAR